MDSAITPRDTRSGERRRRRKSVLSERRSGFDRRESTHCPFVRMLVTLRDSPAALLVLLAAVNVLNLLDQLATTRALAAGFEEGNPVMASLIAWDPRLAAVVKLVTVLGVSFGVWRLRRYRIVLQAGVFTFLVFAGVMLIHFYGSAFCY
jgi:hypothetical protein